MTIRERNNRLDERDQMDLDDEDFEPEPDDEEFDVPESDDEDNEAGVEAFA